jgi:hypothetical protein
MKWISGLTCFVRTVAQTTDKEYNIQRASRPPFSPFFCQGRPSTNNLPSLGHAIQWRNRFDAHRRNTRYCSDSTSARHRAMFGPSPVRRLHEDSIFTNFGSHGVVIAAASHSEYWRSEVTWEYGIRATRSRLARYWLERVVVRRCMSSWMSVAVMKPPVARCWDPDLNRYKEQCWKSTGMRSWPSSWHSKQRTCGILSYSMLSSLINSSFEFRWWSDLFSLPHT